MNALNTEKRIFSSKLKKYFLVTLIGALVFSALLAIWMFIFDSLHWKVIFTTLAVGGYSILGLCCASLLESRRFYYFSLLGIVMSLLSFIMIFIIIWFSSMGEFLAKTAIIFSIMAFSMAHVALLVLLTPLNKKMIRSFLVLTIGLIMIIAAMLIYLIIAGNVDLTEVYYRLLYSIIVLDILGTLVTPILGRIMRQR